MPRIARPFEMWSSVVAILAVSAGSRNVFAPTISPIRIRSVACAHAASVSQPSKIGPIGAADDRIEMVPGPEGVVAEAVRPLAGLEQVGPGRVLVPAERAESDVAHGASWDGHNGWVVKRNRRRSDPRRHRARRAAPPALQTTRPGEDRVFVTDPDAVEGRRRVGRGPTPGPPRPDRRRRARSIERTCSAWAFESSAARSSPQKGRPGTDRSAPCSR